MNDPINNQITKLLNDQKKEVINEVYIDELEAIEEVIWLDIFKCFLMQEVTVKTAAELTDLANQEFKDRFRKA